MGLASANLTIHQEAGVSEFVHPSVYKFHVSYILCLLLGRSFFREISLTLCVFLE